MKFSSRNCIRSSGLAFNIGLGAWRAARLNIIDIDSRRDVVHPLHLTFFLTLTPINGLTCNLYCNNRLVENTLPRSARVFHFTGKSSRRIYINNNTFIIRRYTFT